MAVPEPWWCTKPKQVKTSLHYLKLWMNWNVYLMSSNNQQMLPNSTFNRWGCFGMVHQYGSGTAMAVTAARSSYCTLVESINDWSIHLFTISNFKIEMCEGKSPEVPFHGITSLYSYFEVIWILRQFSKKQNMIKKNYQLNRNKKVADKAQQCFAFLQNSNLLYSEADSLNLYITSGWSKGVTPFGSVDWTLIYITFKM